MTGIGKTVNKNPRYLHSIPRAKIVSIYLENSSWEFRAQQRLWWLVVSDQWLAATHRGYNSLMRALFATLIALMLFTPTRVVAGDSDAAQEALSRPLEWGDAEQLDFDPAKLAIIDHEIGKLVNDDDLPGVIVAIVRRDKLVHHKT